MECPKCHAVDFIKYGNIKGKSEDINNESKIKRYKCKECNCQFTRSTKKGRTEEEKRLSLTLYLEGLGFRSIGRVIGVSNVAVLKWIRKFGEEYKEIHKSQKIMSKEKQSKKVRIMEIDELWTYVKRKKTKDGYGGVLIGLNIPLLAGKLVIVE